MTGNVARHGDLKDGLRKSVVERNCPNMSASCVSRLKGVALAPKDFARELSFDLDVQTVAKTVKRIIYSEHPDPVERQKFMDDLLCRTDCKPCVSEAIRHVYLELYGKLPAEGSV